MAWSKSADWLPLKNAQAQVKFYREDLEFAERFVDLLEGMKVRKDNFMWKVANGDVLASRIRLKRAEEKLYRTTERVFKHHVRHGHKKAHGIKRRKSS